MRQVKHRNKKPIPLLPYLLLLPTLIVVGMFTLYPFLRTVLLSFTVTDSVGFFKKWVGFANWTRILGKPAVWRSVRITLVYAAIVGIGVFSISMVLSLLCVRKTRLGKLPQILYAIPMAIASAPASAVFQFIYRKDGGILNALIGTNNAWLLDERLALVSVGVVSIWLGIGASFIFLLVGFRNVPEEPLESAMIDGANGFQRIIHILIPMASPQIFFVIFLNITRSFKSFSEIKLLTSGGPNGSTYTLIYSVYENAIIKGRFETACVQALMLFAIIMIFSRIQMFCEKRMVHYK